MSSTSISSCNHPIHHLSKHLPNLHKAQCRKIIYYKRYVGKTRTPTRMCCPCYRLRQLRTKPDLVVCHWVTYGNLNFPTCEYCKSSLEIVRPIFQCTECVFSYFERALYERNHGGDINQLEAFAFCCTHKQGVRS